MHESKSVRVHAFGGPEVLRVEPVPIPQAKDDEVLVRVAAASLNPVDYKTREGEFPPVGEDALPAILGRDLAGTIEAVGTRAHYMLRKGDPVFAFIGFDRGGQSGYVVVKALELAAAPASIDLVHAAAVPLAGMTAWQGLFDHGGLQAGQRVLIHGGAGGVGHLAVQFAKAKGATVFVTAGTGDLDYVRSIGADTAIDYKNQRFEDVATDIDLVLDLVGGETQTRSFAVLRDGGTLVSTLDVAEPDKGRDRNIRVPERWLAQVNTKQLGEIAALIDAGKVKVEVAAVFPVEDAPSAYERLEKGHVRGKIVLTF
ncbi:MULTISPECIES: NADP-dependent oxidoreductase [Sphingomonas]|uniref:NADP-dependent oxidoreductase n=1 Tax=Sphingomonas molluscorum TaxID=418184 RepID=A0ABU8QAN7_9SPHN|nr:NADP-dependent oxidoreductase [Sphingomonas sp. JUb134]MBM7408200.1 NADPH:quinone reductase-like Zn-dependent oxidoreductase [Sphingomonas sp. JUb134]